MTSSGYVLLGATVRLCPLRESGHLGNRVVTKVDHVLDEQGVTHRTINSVEDLLGFEAESAGKSVYEETQE